MRKQKLLWVIGFLVSLAGITSAQVDTASISGTVKDSSGAVLPGAQIVILNTDTGIARTLQSDAEGRYTASSLTLGNYQVTATQQGFQTLVRSGITLAVGQEAVVDMAMSVGAMTQKVEVAGEAPVVETTTAAVSGLVSQEQMRDLPLNGRSYTDLTLLTAGVLYNRMTSNSDPGTGFSPRLSVNGARYNNNLYLIDGTVASTTAGDTGAVEGASLGIEAIREFRVLTHNFSAEYGRTSGAVLSLVTRSGTNQFHGSTYEFIRNNDLDARDFFTIGSLPEYRRNQFGAAAGGPIKKDKIFFFANYEGLRQVQGNPIVSTVPDANARQGLVPNAAGQLQQVALSPAVVPYLYLWPLPNNGVNFGNGTAQNVTNYIESSNENYLMSRMDFHLSDKDNLYGRYIYDPSNDNRPGVGVPYFTTPDHAVRHLLVLDETHIFSGTALNDAHVSFNRTYQYAINAITGVTVPPSLSFIPGQLVGYIGVTGLTTTGTAHSDPQSYTQNIFEGADNFTLIRGAHSLKFGITAQRLQEDQVWGQNSTGQFVFTGLTNFLTNGPETLNGALIGTQPNGMTSSKERGFRRDYLGAFVQDDFRVTSRLTVNLGLRYEFFTDPSEINGLSADLINLTDPVATVGAPFHTAKLNFAPRLGVAWDPTGSGKTSIRAGVGIYYNQMDGRDYERLSGSEFLFFQAYTVRNYTGFPNIPANPLTPGAASESAVQYHLPTPTVDQASFDIQRQLTSSILLRLGYVGTYGYHMPRSIFPDIRVPTLLSDGTKFFSTSDPFYNPNFSTIEQLRDDTYYNYNGFQAVLQKAFSHGVLFQLAYSLSKALSDEDAVGGAEVNNAGNYNNMDWTDPSRDYGRSGYDQRNTLTINAMYRLPFDSHLKTQLSKTLLGGWEVNGIYIYGSGMPLNITDGVNQSSNGNTTLISDRPNVAPGFSNNPINGLTGGCGSIPAGQQLSTVTRWYNPCAFVLEPLGTYGNLGRDTVSGPNYNQTNFTVVKRTPLGERRNIEFRAEFFNLFNHPSFGVPTLVNFTSSGYSGSAGAITTTTSRGRQIQGGLKFTF